MCLLITLTCVYRKVSVSYDQLHPKVVNYSTVSMIAKLVVEKQEYRTGIINI